MIFARGSVVNLEGTPIELMAEMTAIIMGAKALLEKKRRGRNGEEDDR